MDIIFVMLVLVASVIVGALIATGIAYVIGRARARRNLQPMLGVVLPKEDKDA